MNNLLLDNYQYFFLTDFGGLVFITLCFSVSAILAYGLASFEFYLKERGLVKKSLHYRHSKSDYNITYQLILFVTTLFFVTIFTTALRSNQIYDLGSLLSSNKEIVSAKKLEAEPINSSDLITYLDRATECINRDCRFSPENSIVLPAYLLMLDSEKNRYSESQKNNIEIKIISIKSELNKLAFSAINSEKALISNINYTRKTFEDNSFFESQLLLAINSLNLVKFSNISSAKEKLIKISKIVLSKETPLSIGFKLEAKSLINKKLDEFSRIEKESGLDL